MKLGYRYHFFRFVRKEKLLQITYVSFTEKPGVFLKHSSPYSVDYLLSEHASINHVNFEEPGVKRDLFLVKTFFVISF